MPARRLFIFDLDNTLYPPRVHLWRVVDARIEAYVRDRLGVDGQTAGRLRKEFLREFGTTLRGLMHHHGVDPGEYLDYVHDVPVDAIVPPRPDLGAMLDALPGRRVVFTNGSASYAGRVLAALGVSRRIDGIFGIEFMEYIAKPSPYPYRKLLQATGAAAEDALFCEDRVENLVPAREMGMFTVWVGGDGSDGSDDAAGGGEGFTADAVVADVCDLPLVLPRFLADADGRAAAVPPSRGRNEGGEEG